MEFGYFRSVIGQTKKNMSTEEATNREIRSKRREERALSRSQPLMKRTSRDEAIDEDAPIVNYRISKKQKKGKSIVQEHEKEPARDDQAQTRKHCKKQTKSRKKSMASGKQFDDEEDNDYDDSVEEEESDTAEPTGKKRRSNDANRKNTAEPVERQCKPKQRNRKKFLNFIRNMTDDQKQAVRDIGFGGFLNVGIKTPNMDLGMYLLNNFNYNKSDLMLDGGDRIHVTEEDVEICYGLPRGKEKVIEARQKYNPEWYEAYIGDWRERWGIARDKGSPKMTDMGNKILGFGGSGEDFKRDFVVFAVSCFIKVHQSLHCTHSILWSLRDTTTIRELNWCKYTLDTLIETTHKWRHNNSEFYTGPLLFLTLCYLDRMEFRGQQISRKIPTITQWTQEAFNARMKEEMNAGGFGKGRPAEHPKEALQSHKEQQQLRHEEEQEPCQLQYNVNQSQLQKQQEDVLFYMKKVARDAENLVNNLGDLMSAAGTLGQFQKSVQKMGQGITGALNTMLNEEKESLTQHGYEIDDDDGFFTESVMETIQKLENLCRNKMTSFADDLPSFDLGLTPDSPLPPTGLDEGLSADEINVRAQVEQESEKSKGVSAAEINAPAQDDQQGEQQELHGDGQWCTNVGQDQLHMGETTQQQDDEAIGEAVDKTIQYFMEKVVDESADHGDTEKSKGLLAAQEEEGQQDLDGDQQHSYSLNEMEKSQQPPQQDRHQQPQKEENQQAQLETEKGDTHQQSEDLSELEQLVCSYAFDKSRDPEEELYWDEQDVLARRNILSMMEGCYVENSIIDKWSKILNMAEKQKTDAPVKRIFMSCIIYTLVDDNLENATLEEKNPGKMYKNFSERMLIDLSYAAHELKDAHMLLFPIAKETHFYIICFNFMSQTLEILDNLPLNTTVADRYGNARKSLTRNLKRWLEEMRHPLHQLVVEICRRKTKFVKTKWQFRSDGDCGIYAMRHMETYMGDDKKWNSGFTHQNPKQISDNHTTTMRKLRSHYTAMIITSATNLLQAELMKRIKDSEKKDTAGTDVREENRD